MHIGIAILLMLFSFGFGWCCGLFVGRYMGVKEAHKKLQAALQKEPTIAEMGRHIPHVPFKVASKP